MRSGQQSKGLLLSLDIARPLAHEDTVQSPKDDKGAILIWAFVPSPKTNPTGATQHFK